MDPPELPDSDLNRKWQKDVHEPGKATCPKCGLLRAYGTAGVANLVARHLDQPICKNTAAKRDKQPCKNGLLTGFFEKRTAPLAKFVKATVRTQSPIRGTGSSRSHEPISAAPSMTATPRTSSRANPHTPSSRVEQLLDDLRTSVELLPSTLPMADQDNPLSEFVGQPTEYVSQTTPPSELWEELAPYFHWVFGYGMGPENRRRMVQRGSSGLDGTLRFLDYFICERGLEGGMVELKIEQLIEAVQSVLDENNVPKPGIPETSLGSGKHTTFTLL
ncbi:hypothetical protein K438DRAFT_1956489 [Mycena galopus ATCC 62051]|nr:hypothetical protein K438DRAFT_1956489 [Mycena galopus ATCC 62051]